MNKHANYLKRLINNIPLRLNTRDVEKIIHAPFLLENVEAYTQAMELKFCCLNWKPLFELYKSFKNLLKEDEKKKFFSGIFGYKWKKRFYWKWREDWRKKNPTVIRRIGNMLAGKIPSCLICFSVWEIRGKKAK